ncbi:DUF3237 domain-containing protein [Rhodococcoides yunnanense]|uniref:DUF3237 domain-containing protein n=1 Tax=Rhodococcoides yunnanense TaxID=278209 RepID=UPI0009331A7B|nr:DUF3237 domain-containing protein [Rhodococcus yunnanensis]
MTPPPAPALIHVLHLEVTVAAAVEVGSTPKGLRRLVPITGGHVSGPLFSGRVLPGGADIQHVRSEIETHVLARYTVESNEGEIVLIANSGIRTGSAEDMARLRRDEPVDPAHIYFRSTPVFETAAPRLARLNSHIYLGSGSRRAGLVVFDIFEAS